jgi:hypothetical protein
MNTLLDEHAPRENYIISFSGIPIPHCPASQACWSQGHARVWVAVVRGFGVAEDAHIGITPNGG